MRLAIIADIHGNHHALEAVLDDIAQQDIDRVIVNGDMVNRGPDNIRVMETISTLDCEIILGNHDDLMVKWQQKDNSLPAEWFHDPFWDAMAWSAQQLFEANWLTSLRDLPMTHHIKPTKGPSILISHGSPRHYREGYSERLRDEAISEILYEYPADILVGSHTHSPLERYWGKHLILNTGAVGCPFNHDARAQYLVMQLTKGQWQHEFRKIPYDLDAALSVYHSSGLLAEGGLGAHLFYLELKNARSFYTPFWMWAEKQQLDHTWENWERFQQAHPERFSSAEH